MNNGKNDFKFPGYITTKSDFYWLNILLNVISSGILILDRGDMSKILVNKEFLEIFNFIDKDDGKPILLNMEDILKINLYRSNGEKLDNGDFPTIKSIEGENIKDLELILKPGTDEEKRILTDSLPIYGKSGDILAAITIISDISELKEIEKNLVKATKGRKLISQDFNGRMLNILNSMVNIFKIDEEYDNQDKDETGLNSNKLNSILFNFVQEILSCWDSVDEVEIREYVELILSLIQEIYDKKVDLKVYGHAPMTLDMVMNCGLIINDIVAYRLRSFQSNLHINEVIADRFPSFHNNNIFEMRIQLNSNEGKIRVKIIDNGPKVHVWTENHIEKTLTLANQLLGELSGFIRIDSNKQLTSFDFEFLYLEI